MIALITGASKGLGYEMAKYLDNMGISLILVSRNASKEKYHFKNILKIIDLDLSIEKNNFVLYEKISKYDIDILINNAGFGKVGNFINIDINDELNMIDLNIKSTHILTKLFLKDFLKKDKGYILNISSSAGFLTGPLFSTYYSTKNYVTRLTMAINEELKHMNTKVNISCFCPGPINTEFNKRANAKDIKAISASFAAKKAINGLFKRKMIIYPNIITYLGLKLINLLPYKLQNKIIYYIQTKKL